MATIYRTEQSSVLWGRESTWADAVTPNMRFGLHEQVTAPDPNLDWYPFYGVASPRSRLTILRGRWDLRASVPDIKLLRGGSLGETLAICIGRLDGNTIKEGISSTDERQNSMTMQIAARDTDGNYGFVRNYVGGKVNRWSLSANEGEELRLNIEEIIFKDIQHNISGAAKDTGAGLGSDPGPNAGGRFIFAGATIQIFGTTVCRIKRFTLSGDNMLEPKYYLCEAAGDPAHLTQVCNDIVEGKRAYSLDIELDMASADTDLVLFKALLNQGATGEDAPTIGGIINADFAVTPGEGGGTMSIACSLGTTATQPGSVVTAGKINIPAPPAGLYPGSYTINVDRVNITVPS